MARVTLARPPLNLLTPSLIAELEAAFRALRDDPGLRLVVLEGAGRAFSAGVEVQAVRDLDPGGARALIESLHAAIRAVRELDAVVLARLHGHVLGGALELVLAADLRLAAASCRLGMPEITVGIPSVIEAALLREWRRVDLEAAIALSMDAFAASYTTDEPRQAMQAFLARRRDRWSGAP